MLTYSCIFILILYIQLFRARSIILNNNTTPDDNCHCKNATLCGPIQRKQYKVIAAYTEANQNWDKYDLDRVTELIVTSDVDKIDSQLICLAHSKGVQLHSAVKVTSEAIFDSSSQEQWIREMVGKLDKFHLDGASISYEEYLPEKKHSQLTKFIDRVYSVLKTANPSYQLSFSVSWYLGTGSSEWYKELSKSVDYFVVRESDMSTVVEGPPCHPGPNAPVYRIMSSLTSYFEAGVPVDHLVAALPWYGYLVTCQNMSSDGKCVMDKCKEDLSERICYGDVVRKYINTGLTVSHWDSLSQSPYLSVEIEDSNLTGEFWFDDGQSLSIKTQAVSRGGYRGVAGYTVDCMVYDGTMDVEVEEMWSSFSVFQ